MHTAAMRRSKARRPTRGGPVRHATTRGKAAPPVRTGWVLLVWGATVLAAAVMVVVVLAHARTAPVGAEVNTAGLHLAATVNAGTELPGGTPTEPAAGFRRLSVRFTLHGVAGASRYDTAGLRLSVPGLAAYPPVATDVSTGSLEEAGSVSGTATFQVPESATNGELSLGSGNSVPLDLPSADAAAVPAESTR